MSCNLISLLPCPSRTLLTRHLRGTFWAWEGSSFLTAQQHCPPFPPLLHCSLWCFHTHIFPSMPPQKDFNPAYKSPALCSAIPHLCSPLSPAASCPSLEVLPPAQPQTSSMVILSGMPKGAQCICFTQRNGAEITRAHIYLFSLVLLLDLHTMVLWPVSEGLAMSVPALTVCKSQCWRGTVWGQQQEGWQQEEGALAHQPLPLLGTRLWGCALLLALSSLPLCQACSSPPLQHPCCARGVPQGLSALSQSSGSSSGLAARSLCLFPGLEASSPLRFTKSSRGWFAEALPNLEENRRSRR